VLACLATLIAVFYAEEDWRGKRDWEKCRRELEAKGAVFDWNTFIPGPVPDKQNIFKAPKMTEWFVRKSWAEAFPGGPAKPRDTTAPFSVALPPYVKGATTLLATVDVIPPEAPLPSGKADAVLRFDDPAARAQAAKVLRERIGPCTDGVLNCVLFARPVARTNPVHLVLQANPVPTPTALSEFLSLDSESGKAGTALGLGSVRLALAGSKGFRVFLTGSVYTATNYLAWSQSAVPDLDLLRQALKRPWARMDNDYQRPFERPIPDFLRMRTVAQLLAQRAQCYLVLGQPGAAWHELALAREMCRMLEAKPASDCPTIVEAMIDAAITGLYTSIIQDGLRLRVWREPELAAMQKRLAEVNFPPLLRRSFEAERAATCRTFEATPPAELRKLFSIGHEDESLWDRLADPTFLLLTFAPHGWLYQNMCAGAPQEHMLLEAIDVPNHQVLPGKLDNIAGQGGAAVRRRSPFNFLAAIALPSFVKATQTMARNQTLANEAFIACGLERYCLAHGQYPETLEALVPQFAGRLPHDIVGGQPLKYRRTADDRFVLYSVGWNEKDDGGVAGKTLAEGDWVWQ
jgi:hypothetical protein